MNEDEKRILDFCTGEWRTLKPLEGQIPHSTLYRLAKSLCGMRLLLHRKGKGYKTTQRGRQELQKYPAQGEAGLQEEPPGERRLAPEKTSVNLAAVQDLLKLSDRQINVLAALYPPLEKVPTRTHQAVIELLWAEVCDRQWPDYEDHHLNFLNCGDTLTWKTSGAKFCAHMIGGQETAPYLIELSTEGGASLWVRKTSMGKIAFKREVLERAYACLEDYHRASREGKEAASHLLTGRTQLPVDNEMQAISCVTMVNLNPKKGDSLFDRTGFDAPLIRRFVPCDLNAIELPDLKRIGQDALDAAKRTGAFERKEPVSDCRVCRAEMNEYVEKLFTEEGQRYIDVEGLINVARGMTGYGLTASEAVRYVLYKVSLPYHTVGWLRPCWTEGAGGMKAAPERRRLLVSHTESEKIIQTSQVEQLQLMSQKREYAQRVEETIDILSSFDSPMSCLVQGDLIDLKEAIGRTASREALDELVTYQENVLQPRVQKAIEERKKQEATELIQDNLEEVEKLFRCAELLISVGELPENLHDVLKDLGCIEEAVHTAGGWLWKTLDGTTCLSLPSEATKLLWIRLQNARGFLKTILPGLPQKEAETFRKALVPVRIQRHRGNYAPPRSTHVITLVNSAGHFFNVRIAIVFKDKDGILLRKIETSPILVLLGRRDIRIDVGGKEGTLRSDSAPVGASHCSAKITSVTPCL